MKPLLISRLSSLVGVFFLLLGSASAAGASSQQDVANSGIFLDGLPASANRPLGMPTGTGGISLIVAGGDHMCSLTSSGGVMCWGRNTQRQLGDGTTALYHTFPMAVVGLSSGIQGIAAGNLHTCALTTAGAIKCWGRNVEGQLGNGGTALGPVPVGVYGLSGGIRAISAGNNFTCALTTAGGVKCWGDNSSGQLGDGSTTQRLKPVDVPGLSNIQAIAAGDAHACALTNTGGVKCWGENTYGQLGIGVDDSDAHSSPADVSGLTGATALAAGGSHTCAVTAASGVVCWGNNFYGQLGDGTGDPHNIPMDVSGLTSGITALTAGLDHTCALTDPVNGPVNERGKVKCWGKNSNGQLGVGSLDDSLLPLDVTGLAGITQITAGWSSTCALTGTGEINCWGRNTYGQLGDTTTKDRLTPVLVDNPKLFLPTIRR